MLTRRGLMKLGTAAAALPVTYGLLGSTADATINPAVAPQPGAGNHGNHGNHGFHAGQAGQGAGGSASAAVPFSVPMVIPPTLAPIASIFGTDFYALTQQAGTAELLPGIRTPVLTYGGSYVGPTIRARVGRRVVITHRNRLDMPTSVHLHGGHVPASSDGHPMDLIQPAQTKSYVYPNRQPGATLWYHDHAHHAESEHVYRGLHGFYLLQDEQEAALGLPRGACDVPVMLTDARIGADGALIFEQNDFRGRTTVLVNGRAQPFFRVAARKYRFRLLDAANLRFFRLSLGAGDELVQVASDGGLLPAPFRTSHIALSPGERADVVIDFSRYPVGSQILLQDSSAGPILRFDVTREAADNSRVPDVLCPLPPLPTATAVRNVTLSLNLTEGAFQIDGKAFDPNRVDAVIKRGTTEIWQITNTDTQLGIPHNLHLHLVQFRVLDRNGQPPGPAEAGLKDTVVVAPGHVVRVQATFGPYLGRYVYHCHMLDHSATGMMAQMEIVP